MLLLIYILYVTATIWHKGILISIFQAQKLSEQQIGRLQGITVYVLTYNVLFFLPYIVDYIVGIYNLPLLLLYPFMCYRCTPLPAVLGACLTSSQYSTAPVSSEDLQLIQTILKWPPENTFPGWQLEHTQHRITLLLFCKELCMPWR